MYIDTTTRFVTIAVTTLDTPAAETGTLPAMTHLATVAMLIALRDRQNVWTFTLAHRAIGAGDSENALLDWATAVMPESGIVIGWQLADAVVEPLLDAAREGDPEVAAAFLARFVKLVTAPSVDLAIAHGGAGAPPLATVLAHRDIDVLSATPAQVESAWAFGNTAWLCEQADSQAVATWRLWLAEANGMARAASEAFEAWLAHRLR